MWFGLKMSAKYVVPAVLASFAIALAKDHYIADRKIFGGNSVSCGWLLVSLIWSCEFTVEHFTCFLDSGTTPRTVADKEWWEETDRKFQAWPRTAGPPVVMNPISRQNFIVKSRPDA